MGENVKTTISISPEALKIWNELTEEAKKWIEAPIGRISKSLALEGILALASAHRDEAIAWILAKHLEKEKNMAVRVEGAYKCIPIKLNCFGDVENLDLMQHKYGPMIEGRVFSLNGNLWELYVTLPVTSKDFFVDVWNVQGTLYVWDETKKKYVPEDEFFGELSEECKGLLSELKRVVVEEENNMAFNISGKYYPLGQKSVKIFNELMEKCGPHRKTEE